MSKPILAEVLRDGAPAARYDIARVAADPRLAPGLAAELGTEVVYVGAQGSVLLQKYTTWDRGWRLPGGGPLYPKTADEFLGATKLTPSGLYLMDAMVGTVFDASGNGNDLPVTNTPTFQRTLEEKVGVYYDANNDNHQGAVNDPGAGSFLFGCEGALISDPGGAGVNNFVGRIEAATVEGYTIVLIGGALDLYFKDAAGVTINTAFAGGGAAVATNPRVPYLITGQADRATGRLRGRMSRGGVAFATIDVAIGALGTLTQAGQQFGFGAIAGGTLNGGARPGYGFYVTGAQCEGANVLRDLAVGLGWEV